MSLIKTYNVAHKINRVSHIFQPTTISPKNMPKLNENALSKSNRLMLDLGIIRPSNTGIFHSLPLGVRAMNKLKNIVRKEMDSIGAQEVKFPLVLDSDLWKKSGRWTKAGSDIFKFNDRHENQFLLSPTNEESAAELISSIPQLSHKNFPLMLYQINSKFRDEMKPRCGLLRSREFIMKDLYSFDINLKQAEETYYKLSAIYANIFENLELDVIKVSADPGDMGGVFSHEYHLNCNEGEDLLTHCSKCGNIFLSAKKTKCDNCQSIDLNTLIGLEVGHTFLLGTRYTKPLETVFKNENGKLDTPLMGSFGLGLSRILGGSIEMLSKNDEIRWPKYLSPYQIVIIPPKEGSRETPSENLQYDIYDMLNSLNSLTDDVIIDDRNKMTIGKRIVHAKRTGYPFIVVIGSKSVQDPPLFELIDVYNDKFHDVTIEQLYSIFKN